jgi:aryl-alcohol dehydrogenase-like predicted oxidoreductase
MLERTVEGELIPMAQDMGLGVTPWGPLKSGVLSGKYTRENRDKMKSDRGDHVTGSLTDRAYDLLDELQKIAKELSSTVAAVSLAWVHSRPRVTSTMQGLRSIRICCDEQLAFHCELVVVRLTEVLIRQDTLGLVPAIASPVLA